MLFDQLGIFVGVSRIGGIRTEKLRAVLTIPLAKSQRATALFDDCCCY